MYLGADVNVIGLHATLDVSNGISNSVSNLSAKSSIACLKKSGLLTQPFRRLSIDLRRKAL